MTLSPLLRLFVPKLIVEVFPKDTELAEKPIKFVVIFLFFASNLNDIFSDLEGIIVNLILSPSRRLWFCEVVTIPE